MRKSVKKKKLTSPKLKDFQRRLEQLKKAENYLEKEKKKIIKQKEKLRLKIKKEKEVLELKNKIKKVKSKKIK
ncbi:MAG: hypothetical protein ACOC3Z_01170 [Nanoarchaeota archaeon]